MPVGPPHSGTPVEETHGVRGTSRPFVCVAALAPALSPGLPRPKVIEHHSGRPWLVGDWPDDEIVFVSVGPRRSALLGCTTVRPDVLEARLGLFQSLADLDELGRLYAGSFHLVRRSTATSGSRALSTACQVFYARVAGVTLAASRAETLASRIGASVDTERVALELLSPFGPPEPLSEGSVWRGVRSPRIGHCLEIGSDGAGRTRRWWTSPEPERPLGDGGFVREALFDAVAARTAGQKVVSADLSGGLDSRASASSPTAQSARTWPPCTTRRTAAGARIWPTRAGRRPYCRRPATWRCRRRTRRTGMRRSAHAARPAGGPADVRPVQGHRRAPGGPRSLPGARRHLQASGATSCSSPAPWPCTAAPARSGSRPAAPARDAVQAPLVDRHRRCARCGRAVDLRLLATETTNSPRPRLGSGAYWEISAKLPPWITPDAASSVRRLLREDFATDPEPLSRSRCSTR